MQSVDRACASRRPLKPLAVLLVATVVSGVLAETASAQALLRIEIRPRERTLEIGETRPMTAVAVFEDDTTRDITDLVLWTSSDTNIVGVNPTRGHVTGIGFGVALISATLPGSGVSSTDSGDDAEVRVPAKLVSISVLPKKVDLPVGLLRSLDADGTFEDGSTADVTNKVEWESSDASVVRVDNTPGQRGQIRAIKPGSATIRAIDLDTGVSSTRSGGDAQVTVWPPIVGIEITPPREELFVGFSRRFSARAVLEDDSTLILPRSSILWTTSDPRVATVANASDSDSSPAGLVTALSPGQVTLSGIHIETGIKSSADAVITILDPLISIEVTPRDRRIEVGESKSMTATATLADGQQRDITDQVVWASSAPRILSVSNVPGSRGQITAIRSGVAFISATFQDGVSSSDSEGDARVRVTADLASLRILPETLRLAVGFTVPLDAQGRFADGTVDDVSSKVTWISDDPDVATISNAPGSQGEVTAVATGATTIRVVDPGTGISSSDSQGDGAITVAGDVARLLVTPPEEQLSVGESRRYSVRAIMDDDSTFNLPRTSVDWTSSEPTIATVDNDPNTAGLVTARAVGETLISGVHRPTGTVAEDAALRVRGELLSIRVTPRNRQINVGETKSMTAIGTFSDGSEDEVTDDVTWSSTNLGVLTISNLRGTRGHAVGVSPGVASVSATAANGISSSETGGDARVRVVGELVRLRVVPGDVRLALGFARALEAEGTFTDGSVANVSRDVEWSTSDPGVAAIGNAPDTKGDLTAVSDGTAVISVLDLATGTSSTLSDGDALVTVGGQVVGLAVTPRAETLPIGLTRRFTARAIFDDGTGFPLLRGSVEWHSSSPTVAIVSNDLSSRGVATALARGETRVSAVHRASGASSDESNSALLTVPGSLAGIEVQPGERGLFIGTTQQLRAFGILDDSRTIRLSRGIEFVSSRPSVAAVSNNSGTRGNVTGVSVGTATISVTHPASGLSSSSTDGDTRVRVIEAPETIRVTGGRRGMRTGDRRSLRAFGAAPDPEGSVNAAPIEVEMTSDVDFRSSDPGVILLDDRRALAVGVGSAVVSARDPVSGLTSTASGGNASFRVDAKLKRLKIKPRKIRIRVDSNRVRAFRAIAVYSDRARINITDRIEFSTADPAIAEVSNDRSRSGEVLPVSPGVTRVRGLEPITGIATKKARRIIVKSAKRKPSAAIAGVDEGQSVGPAAGRLPSSTR